MTTTRQLVRTSGRRSRLRIVGAGIAVAMGCALAAAAAVIALPPLDEPARAEFVLVLGPPMVQRLVKAEALIDDGLAERMVISVPPSAFDDDEHTKLRDLCRGESEYEVECVTPDPFTTQGEARLASELMAAHDWDSVIVVTSVSHVSRARMLFDRCLTAPGEQSLFVSDDRVYDPSLWLDELIYQSAAWVKALLKTGC